jgi:hypothetical protein
LIKKQQAISLYDGNEVESAKTMFEELMALQKKEYGGSCIIIAEVNLQFYFSIHCVLLRIICAYDFALLSDASCFTSKVKVKTLISNVLLFYFADFEVFR